MKIDNIEQFKDILKQLGDTYERKNHDYGSSIENGINDLGYIYSVCQLYNKFMRFKNLVSKNDFEGRVGESLADTLLDMSVYAIETARVLQNNLEFVNMVDEIEAERLDEEKFIHKDDIISNNWADWGEEI